MPYKDGIPEPFSDEVVGGRGDDSDDDVNDPLVEKSEKSHITSWRPIIHNKGLRVSGAILVSFFLALLIWGTFEGERQQNQQRYDCGSSPEEARVKDCQFDMLAFAWVPKPCFNEELAASWDTYHRFDFFYDSDHTQPISISELKKGINHYVFTTPQYHRSHCVYAWQTLQRAVKQGSLLSDNKTLSLDHYDHCSYYLVNINDTYQARFQMDYLYCDGIQGGQKTLFW